MTTFDDREKGFERKFTHDQELLFKINARRNKLLGLWAAEKLGKKGADAEHYAKEVAIADLEAPGDSDVMDKLLKDFAHGKVAVSEKDIRVEMERLHGVARKQIQGDPK